MRTITVTAKDQSGNPIQGYQFSFDITVTQSDPTEVEAYGLFVGGSPVIPPIEASSTNSILPATDVNGKVTLGIVFLTNPLESGDSISVQIKTADNLTNIGNAFTYSK